MAEPKLEFTHVTSLRAEALGEPGSRTFRLLVDSTSGSAIIWLEKEQLLQLALAVNQLVAGVPEGQGSPETQPHEEETPRVANLEFKASRLVLGRDGVSGMFFMDAHETDSGVDDPATVRVWGERSQVMEFAREALRVCAAGRPICSLCGSPIDPTGHLCPRTNGHGSVEMEF